MISHKHKLWIWIAVLIILSSIVCATGFQVNELIYKNWQMNPAVAVDGAGNSIVAFGTDHRANEEISDIYAKKYDADYETVIPEFRVDTEAGNFAAGEWFKKEMPSTAVDSSGNFIVVWRSSQGEDYTYDIYAQRYLADGAKNGNEFRVNDYLQNDQTEPEVAMAPDGSFIITWQSGDQDGSGSGIYAKRYSSNGIELAPPNEAKKGTEQGNEFRVNTLASGYQTYPAIAVDSQGNFIIVWYGYTAATASSEIYAQRYGSDGKPKGNEFMVNSYTKDSQISPAVGMSSQGNFVVAWRSNAWGSAGQDGDNSGVYAKRYNSEGVEQEPPAGVVRGEGNEFRINTHTTGNQLGAKVAMNSKGNFVIVWQSYQQYGDYYDLYAKTYSSNGNELAPPSNYIKGQGNEFMVNNPTDYYYISSSPSVSINDNGLYVITWSSNNNPDEEDDDIYAEAGYLRECSFGQEQKGSSCGTYSFNVRGCSDSRNWDSTWTCKQFNPDDAIDTCTAASLSFAKSGETTIHGEYSLTDISSKKSECCGDDSNEIYDPHKCADTPTDVHACCNSANDFVDADGKCISESSCGISAAFTITTHEKATCKYNRDEDLPFSQMQKLMSASEDSLEHVAEVSKLAYNTDYSIFVRCQDEVGNENEPGYEVVLNLGKAPVTGLDCKVSQTCEAGYTPIFKMSALTNAEAELATQSNYNYKVCCKSPTGILSSDCGIAQPEQHLINLHAQTNAHVEQGDKNNYQNKVCLSNTNPEYEVKCSYKTAACANDETCVAALSGPLSAHISDCTSQGKYSINICCKEEKIEINCGDLTDDICANPLCRGIDPVCDKATCAGGDICMIGCATVDPDCGLGTCAPGDGCAPNCVPLDTDCDGGSCYEGDVCLAGCIPADPDCKTECDEYGISSSDCNDNNLCSAGNFCVLACATPDPDCGQGETTDCDKGNGCKGGSCETGDPDNHDPDCDGATCQGGDGCLAECVPADPDCTLPTCAPGDGCKPGCQPVDTDCLKATCKPGDMCMIGCAPADPDCGLGSCDQGDGCKPNCPITDYDCDGASCNGGDVCLVGCATPDPDCSTICQNNNVADCSESNLCNGGNFCVIGCGPVDPDCGEDDETSCSSSNDGCEGGDKVCSFLGVYNYDTDCGEARCEEGDACLADCETEDPDCDKTDDFTPFFPEGVYEPLCCADGTTGESATCGKEKGSVEHVYCENTAEQIFSIRNHNLEFTFPEMTVSDATAECTIKTSDGTDLVLHGSGINLNSEQYVLSKYISKTMSIDKTKPWTVESCTMTSGTGEEIFKTTTNPNLYVHNNVWSGDGIDADGNPYDYQASLRCLGGKSGQYFDNQVKCHPIGDALFSFTLYKDNNVEQFCYDHGDNDDDTYTDRDDSDCWGITYPNGHIAPETNENLFSTDHGSLTGNIIFNFAGLITGKVVSSGTDKCKGNICAGSFDVKNAQHKVNYQYTQQIKPGGSLKVRFNFAASSVNSYIATGMQNLQKGFSTYGKVSKPGLSIAGTDVVADNNLGYTPESDVKSGPVDRVIYVTFANLGTSSKQSFNLFAQWDQMFEWSPKLDFYPDNAAPDTNKENDDLVYSGSPETNKRIWGQYDSSGTDDESAHQCNDRVDNDLDYKFDCMDDDCNSAVIGKREDNQPIKCEYQAETTCFDGYDNDHDNKVDCADPDCAGKVGGYKDAQGTIQKYFISDAQPVFCESAEGFSHYSKAGFGISSCDDRFDNDADNNAWLIAEYSCSDYSFGKNCDQQNIDCYDSAACWGRGEKQTDISTYPCPQFENNEPSWCSDSIDNDFDRELSNSGWKNYDIPHPYGFGPFKEVFVGDKSGSDCFDYDCRGASNCPETESVEDKNCFDGIDNDLDAYKWDDAKYVADDTGGIDCQDPDCLGKVNPDNLDQICEPYEFWLFKYDKCKDSVDNDYDGKRDGFDDVLGYDSTETDPTTDCRHRFKKCGVPGFPGLSEVESINAFACADNEDNDNDGLKNCADILDCNGALGTSYGARCGPEICNDDFDNDNDGKIDCADPDCDGKTNSRNAACRNTEQCADGVDNNGDGQIDCAEPSCNNECQLKGWTKACLEVPYAPIIKIGDINLKHDARQYVGLPYTLEFSGSGKYNANDIRIFLATASQGLPYDLSKCSLEDTTGKFLLTIMSSKFGNINLNQPIDGSYDIKLNCPTQATPKAQQSYLIEAVIKGTAKSSATVSHQLYENEKPKITKIAVEGLKNNEVTLYYGDSFDILAQPDDEGTYDSNICGCNFKLNGQETGFVDCKTTVQTVIQDKTGFTTAAIAKDGVSNVMGAYNAGPTFNIVVKPIETTSDYKLSRAFYNSEITSVEVGEFKFITAANRQFKPDCKFNVKKLDGTVVTTFTQAGTVANNELKCAATLDLAAIAINSQDGMYLINVDVQDKDRTDFTISSKPKIFYVCNSKDSRAADSSWDCKYLDIDNDLMPEGTFTDLYKRDAVPGSEQYTCDNCPDIYNPDQADKDADGLGNVCDCNLDELSNDGEICDKDCINVDPDCRCDYGKYPCFIDGKLTCQDSACLLFSCNKNNICEDNEPCACTDCLGKQDSCKKGLRCAAENAGWCDCNGTVEGFCPSTQCMTEDDDCIFQVQDLRIIYPTTDDILAGNSARVYWTEKPQEIQNYLPITFDLSYYNKTSDSWQTIVQDSQKNTETINDSVYLYYDWDIKALEEKYKGYELNLTAKTKVGEQEYSTSATSGLFTVCRSAKTNISGIVADGTNNNVIIKGATVKTMYFSNNSLAKETTTDESGYYALMLDPKEKYSIIAHKDGLVDKTEIITPQYCDNKVINFMLTKCGDNRLDTGENCKTCWADAACKPNEICTSSGTCITGDCEKNPDGTISNSNCLNSNSVCEAGETCCCPDCFNQRRADFPWRFCSSDGTSSCACYSGCGSVTPAAMKTDCTDCQKTADCAPKAVDIQVKTAKNIITMTKIAMYKGKPVKVRVVVWN